MNNKIKAPRQDSGGQKKDTLVDVEARTGFNRFENGVKDSITQQSNSKQVFSQQKNNIFSDAKKYINRQTIENLFPGGTWKGKEYLILSPIISRPKPDNNVGNFSISENGLYHDFATNESGDFIKLVSLARGIKPREAAKLIIQTSGGQALDYAEKRITEYIYPDKFGNPLLKVIRTDFPDGNKTFFQKKYIDGKFVNGGISGPLPLLNMPDIVNNPLNKIVICEGEKAALAHIIEGFIFTTWPQGANSANRCDVSILQDRDIILFPDNDLQGLKAKDILKDKLQNIAKSVKVVDVSQLPSKGDAADITRDQALKLLKSAKEHLYSVEAEVITAPKLRKAFDILNTEFKPLRYLISPMLTTGLHMLAGAPKIGKSWLVLLMCRAISSGYDFLNKYNTERTGVLYIALEDNERRIKSRLELIGGINPDAEFYVQVEWNKGKQGVFDIIETIKTNPTIGLYVIDTFGRFTGVEDMNSYGDTVQACKELQEIAMEYDVAVVFIHHTKKAETEDFLLQLLGSQGIAGTADSIWHLSKKRGERTARLQITGRDLEKDIDQTITMQGATWIYTHDGEPISPERQQILELLENSDTDLTPKEIAKMLNKNENTTRGLIKKMCEDGTILKTIAGYTVNNNELF